MTSSFSKCFLILMGNLSVVACLGLASGCIFPNDSWMGSVDAVFRYRTAEHSTVIHEVRPGSFSEEAGLMAGDILLAVDGADITNATYEGVRGVLKGPVGTKAVLTIKRGVKIIDVAVERRSASVNEGPQGASAAGGTKGSPTP